MVLHDKQHTPRSVFSNPSEDEKLYFDMIRRALKSKDDRIISNGKPAHAIFLIGKFLEVARSHVNIFTGQLKRTFDGVLAYEEPKLAQLAVEFLRRGGELKILIRDDPDVEVGQTIADHPFLEALSNSDIGSGRLVVSHFDGEPPSNPSYHFVVMDGEAFRLEVDTEQARAYVRLNDPKTCSLLDSVFSNWMESGETLFSLPNRA